MFGTKKQLQEIFPVCNTTLNTYRKSRWIEGVHFQRLNSRHILYNLDLIKDFLINVNDPKNHEKTIKRYMKNIQNR